MRFVDHQGSQARKGIELDIGAGLGTKVGWFRVASWKKNKQNSRTSP